MSLSRLVLTLSCYFWLLFPHALADGHSCPQSLSSLRYLNEGVVKSNDTYRLVSIAAYYNEGYSYMGSGSSTWQMSGSLEYLFKGPAASILFENADMPGGDYATVPGLSDFRSCAARCEQEHDKNPPCKAWVFDNSSSNGSVCYLKSAQPLQTRKDHVWAGCSTFFKASCPDAGARLRTARLESLSTPPSGMRSSVPLGPLGEGSVELRADGRLADWGTMFNNGPYTTDKAWARKIDVDDAAFGVLIGSCAKALRTHPPSGLPPVAALRYSGAFPAARLRVEEPQLAALGVDVTMDAFSEFELHSPENSAAPIVFFAFTIAAAGGANGEEGTDHVDASVFFNLPDMLGASIFQGHEKGFTLRHSAERLKTGNLSWSLVHCAAQAGPSCEGVSVSFAGGASAATNWQAFVRGGGRLPNEMPVGAPHAAAAATVRMARGSRVTLTFALTWFFPHRLWGPTDLGHFYQNSYRSSEDVAAREGTAKRINEVLEAILAWQYLCYNNTLPPNLQDSLINTPATWGKTSFWTKDGRWRNFESHSCAQVEPPHIHFYRALGYSLLMPTLERQTPELYSDTLPDNGEVKELFGCSCGTCAGSNDDLDTPKGGMRGDDNAVFILDVYMNYKWHDDGKAWLSGRWASVQKALSFMLLHAPSPYYLPYRMINTNDEHGIIGDVNAYNAFAYLAALAAGAALADAVGDAAYAQRCRGALAAGRAALERYLWSSEGHFWRQAWCESLPGTLRSQALQGGGLYGQLWAHVLGLEAEVNVSTDQLHSHLQGERDRNLSPLGLVFVTNRTFDYYGGCPKAEGSTRELSASSGSSPHLGANFIDQDVWNSHSMTHAAMSIYTGYGRAADALGVAGRVMDAYQKTMADQWDYRDTTTPYSQAGQYDPKGLPRPSVNSHYARQTIWWALPLALTGQRFDAQSKPKTLSFEPSTAVLGDLRTSLRDSASAPQWPLLLPQGSALVRLGAGRSSSLCAEIHVLSGSLALHPAHLKLTITLQAPKRVPVVFDELSSSAGVQTQEDRFERGSHVVLCGASVQELFV